MATEYLDDVITQMRQADSLVGGGYTIPVYCILLYSSSDVFTLESSGQITSTFTAQDLADEYFNDVVISDIQLALGNDLFTHFSFTVKTAVADVPSSQIIVFVNSKAGWDNKVTDLQSQAASAASAYTQQQYLEDMITRNARKYTNR